MNPRRCAACGADLRERRPQARYFSGACRAAASRLRRLLDGRPWTARAVVEDLLDMRATAAERLAKFRENPRAVGSRGQEVEHATLKEYLALQVRILQLSETILRTPRARVRAGVDEPEDEMSLDFLDEELASARVVAADGVWRGLARSGTELAVGCTRPRQRTRERVAQLAQQPARSGAGG